MIGVNIKEPAGQETPAAEQVELREFGVSEPVVARFRGKGVVIGRSDIGSLIRCLIQRRRGGTRCFVPLNGTEANQRCRLGGPNALDGCQPLPTYVEGRSLSSSDIISFLIGFSNGPEGEDHATLLLPR